LGNKEDVQTKPVFGVAMMGGGSDLDEAFRWLCNRGNGGDFLESVPARLVRQAEETRNNRNRRVLLFMP